MPGGSPDLVLNIACCRHLSVLSASPGFSCHTHWISLVKPADTKLQKHLMTSNSLVFCCVIQDPRFSSIFIFSFGTSVQDTYCLHFRCICNPSQSISLNARLIKCSQDQLCCWYCHGWIKEYHPSSLSDWRLPSLLLHYFKNCYGSAVFHRHWFHIPGKWTSLIYASAAPPWY